MTETLRPGSSKRLFGTPVAAATLPEVLHLVHETVLWQENLRIGVVNAAKIVNLTRDHVFREQLLSSDIIVADGMSVVVASRLLGRRIPERITGIDLMYGILALGNRHRYRLYCLGATDEVLEAVTAKIATEYPGINIVGRRNGYFSATADAAVAAEIAACRPDVLFVAMPSPRKEAFLATWGKHMRVPVCHGVGGSFDVMAGKVRRAPKLWQRLGLEWLYRLLQEPGRLWRRYLVTNTLFCRMLLTEWFRSSE